MNDTAAVFVDANALVYFLDETADLHASVVELLQRLVDEQTDLYTSHHVLEEVLFIVSRLSSDKEIISAAVEQVASIPNLNLVEPVADFEFAERYAKLYRNSKVGINDTLLLQLILDAQIPKLLSYDQEFLKQANLLKLKSVI